MIRNHLKYYLFLLSFVVFTTGMIFGQQVPESFRNNILKINVLPVAPLINGHNQKWIGLEYERFLQQKLSLSATLNVGLFEDYTYKKYHDFFEEDQGFSYTQTDVSTRGYHFIPTIRYYFLFTKSKKGRVFTSAVA